METIFFILFYFCFSVLGVAQNFRYFKPDTMSSSIVYLKLKGEENWSKPLDVDWHWQKTRQLIEYVEEDVFKAAFEEIDWKEVSVLSRVGVFFRFNKSFHIDYLHFTIPSSSFSREDLVRLEFFFLDYARLLKKVDLSPYLYTDDPAKFEYGIGRFLLIRENSSVWNEK